MHVFRQSISLFLLIWFPLVFVGAVIYEAYPVPGKWLLGSGFACVSFYLVSELGFSWYQRRKAKSILCKRPQLHSEEFGRYYFSETPERAMLAAKIRDSLALYLKLPLEGLLPDDNLNEVCDAQTDDPSMLWHLEEEFGLKPLDDFGDVFDSLEKELRTFRGVLEYVENEIRELK